MITLLLLLTNRDVTINAFSKIFEKLSIIDTVYEPRAEKDPHLTKILSALQAKMEKSYGNPYRISTFKKPESKHRDFVPPAKVVGPYEVDYVYYASSDIGVKAGDWNIENDYSDAYGTNRHATRVQASKLETDRLRSVLPGLDESMNPALRYQGSFLDLSGEVHVDHNGIWRKEKKEQTQTNTYKIEDDKAFIDLVPLAKCPDTKPQWAENPEPMIKTDPTKFITGTYIWGPNNQSRGLRELVLMSVKMNRTLALPPFFKHWGTDTTVEKKSTPVDASTRLDINHLRNLITIIKPEKMAEKCNVSELLHCSDQLCLKRGIFSTTSMRTGPLDEIIATATKSIVFT